MNEVVQHTSLGKLAIACFLGSGFLVELCRMNQGLRALYFINKAVLAALHICFAVCGYLLGMGALSNEAGIGFDLNTSGSEQILT